MTETENASLTCPRGIAGSLGSRRARKAGARVAQREGRTAAAGSALALVDARRPVVRGRKGARLLVAVAAACSRATVKTITIHLFVSFVPFEGRRRC